MWLSPRLDAALTGRLPCVVCGYELQGLSIRGVCPECGAAVRATILYQVDPDADEFKPMRTPRLTAWCLVICAVGSLLLMVAGWAPRLADIVGMMSLRRPPTALAAGLSVLAAAVSGVCMLGLIKPSRETPLRRSFGVMIAALAFAPLAWAIWTIHGEIDPVNPAPFIDPAWRPGGRRTMFRLIFGASAIAILLGFRPVARELVRRSLALRTGRVDRQTLFAMVGALLIAATGDVLHLIAGALPSAETTNSLLSVAGTMFVAVGSGFLTLGVVGAAIDSWRVRGAILTPAPSLRQIIGPADPLDPSAGSVARGSMGPLAPGATE